MFQDLLHTVLQAFVRQGELDVLHADGTRRRYGNGKGPRAGLAIRDAAATRRLVMNPALAFGELYMEGRIEPVGCSIAELLELVVINQYGGGQLPAEAALERLRRAWRRVEQRNRLARARRNVAHHYDLNGRLYSLFLDRDRQYSCAYFRTGDETLEEAQAAKKRHIAAKLKLDRPGLEVLDIGCGWGGLALHLARDWGARVTGITLSAEQLAAARQRARDAGLEDRLRFEMMDYREWRRPVDRIVSVGMFEHVGLTNYATFFRTLRDALRPDGVALVHAIGMRGGPAGMNPWITKYIFPGGYTPALSEVLPAIEAADLWVTDIEILRRHYALTLAAWRRRFAANRDAIAALYDERFCRMFEFYLAGCEMAFRHGGQMVWQVQLAREADALPLTRDYIAEAEAAAPLPVAG